MEIKLPQTRGPKIKTVQISQDLSVNLKTKEKEQLKSLIKPQQPNKLVYPKQDGKLKESDGQYLAIRGQNK